MSKLSKEQFEAYLEQIKNLAEGPFEEMQPEIEVTNVFPEKFYELAKENDLYRFALPAQYGGWDLSELDILRVQEQFSRGPGGMRMHLHYAADLNWRILDDYGSDELKAQYMDKFQDKTIFTCFALTEQSGGTGADIHTTAVKDENGDYILNGEKWLISHTDCCEFAYVIAVTDETKSGDERLSAFFVPVDTPGYEVTPMPHMMGARGAAHTGLKFTDMKLDKKYLLGEEGKDSYSVLRGPFDQWLAEKAEEAGAEYICGIAVEELIKDGSGRVTGVRAGDDEITADVVILAEGTNSMLSERCLGNARPKANQMAVGIKEVFELPSDVIEDRFLLPEGEGAAMLFVGDCTKGSVGGGFLYTNKESISLGLVATISLAADGSRNEVPVYQMLEDFKSHPAVAPIIRGAKMVEHSGHMVPEGGYDMIPRYVFDGCLIAGETAGLCMNMGYQVRGMDFAVASGRMAAEAAVAAIDAGDTSAAGLASYKSAMEGSFVIQDLRTFSKWPHVMEEWSSMFTDYPVMVKEVFNAMFSVDGAPQQPLMKRMRPIIKKRGVLKLGREVMKAVKAL